MPTSSHRRGAGRDPAPAPMGLAPPPMARVERVSLVRREVREYLPPSALEVLLRCAEVVIEGEPLPDGDGFSGTLMVTMDLRAVAGLVREAADAATADRVAGLLCDVPDLASRLSALSARAVGPRLGRPVSPEEVSVDFKVRSRGCRVLVDVDIVARRGRST